MRHSLWFPGGECVHDSFADQMEFATPLPVLLDERVLDLPDQLLDLLPVGVYVCDHCGLIVRYNRAAAELWGYSPEIGDHTVRFCGSYRLYGVKGALIPHAKCPMADVLASCDLASLAHAALSEAASLGEAQPLCGA